MYEVVTGVSFCRTLVCEPDNTIIQINSMKQHTSSVFSYIVYSTYDKVCAGTWPGMWPTRHRLVANGNVQPGMNILRYFLSKWIFSRTLSPSLGLPCTLTTVFYLLTSSGIRDIRQHHPIRTSPEGQVRAVISLHLMNILLPDVTCHNETLGSTTIYQYSGLSLPFPD